MRSALNVAIPHRLGGAVEMNAIRISPTYRRGNDFDSNTCGCPLSQNDRDLNFGQSDERRNVTRLGSEFSFLATRRGFQRPRRERRNKIVTPHDRITKAAPVELLGCGAHKKGSVDVFVSPI